jgi:hypothetical protein
MNRARNFAGGVVFEIYCNLSNMSHVLMFDFAVRERPNRNIQGIKIDKCSMLLHDRAAWQREVKSYLLISKRVSYLSNSAYKN